MSDKKTPPEEPRLLRNERDIETAPPPTTDPTTPSLEADTARYQDIQRLSKGGMSSVSKARDTQQDKLVAIKTFAKHRGEVQASLRARIRREFEILREVRHPNIVEVYENWEKENSLILELINGETLRSYFSRQKETEQPADIRWIRSVFFSLLDAIEHVHNKGYAFLDLKPENIMLTSEGIVKLIDFGMAHPLGEPLGREAEGGTDFYTAPEHKHRDVQKTQDLPCRASADIYSLGAILFEMFTYEIARGQLGKIEDFYLNKGWRLLQRAEDLDVILAESMAFSPLKRFQLVPQLRERLNIFFNYEFQKAPLHPQGIPISASEIHHPPQQTSISTQEFIASQRPTSGPSSITPSIPSHAQQSSSSSIPVDQVGISRKIIGLIFFSALFSGFVLWILFFQGKLFSSALLDQKTAPEEKQTQALPTTPSKTGASSLAKPPSKSAPTNTPLPSTPSLVVQSPPRPSIMPSPVTRLPSARSVAELLPKKPDVSRKVTRPKKRSTSKRKSKKRILLRSASRIGAASKSPQEQGNSLLPPTQASPPTQAFLDASISPPCDLYQGERNLGVAFGRLLPFPPGKHDLRCVKRDGYVFHRFSVVIQPGKTTRYSRLLGKGGLFILSYPWAKVCLPDFDFHCIGSSQEMLSLYEGKYRVVLLKEGNPEHRRELTVHIRPKQTSRPKVIW